MHVELHCRLCPHPAPIESTSRTAHVDAVDHCLDLHRADLLADPDATERAIVVSLPARPLVRHAVVAA